MEKTEPLRMCVVCREMRSKKDLIRIVFQKEQENGIKLNKEDGGKKDFENKKNKKDKKDKKDKRAKKNGKVFIDIGGKSAGRGAYLCKSESCINTAIKQRTLNRALACEIPAEVIEKLKETLN